MFGPFKACSGQHWQRHSFLQNKFVYSQLLLLKNKTIKPTCSPTSLQAIYRRKGATKVLPCPGGTAYNWLAFRSVAETGPFFSMRYTTSTKPVRAGPASLPREQLWDLKRWQCHNFPLHLWGLFVLFMVYKSDLSTQLLIIISNSRKISKVRTARRCRIPAFTPGVPLFPTPTLHRYLFFFFFNFMEGRCWLLWEITYKTALLLWMRGPNNPWL